MSLILNKKHKKTVDSFKKLIKTHEELELEIFVTFCDELSIDPDSEEAETLFDHLYNDTEWTIKYK